MESSAKKIAVNSEVGVFKSGTALQVLPPIIPVMSKIMRHWLPHLCGNFKLIVQIVRKGLSSL